MGLRMTPSALDRIVGASALVNELGAVVDGAVCDLRVDIMVRTPAIIDDCGADFDL